MKSERNLNRIFFVHVTFGLHLRHYEILHPPVLLIHYSLCWYGMNECHNIKFNLKMGSTILRSAYKYKFTILSTNISELFDQDGFGCIYLYLTILPLILFPLKCCKVHYCA